MSRLDTNYAKVGETDRWDGMVPIDVKTGKMIIAAEVNCKEGWAVVLQKYIGSNHWRHVRIKGQFRLMTRKAAEKLGVEIK